MKIVWIVLISAVILLAGIYIYGKVTYQKNFLYSPNCLTEGIAAENASLGPNGHFGTCCPGLEPKVKPGEEELTGQAAYCTKIK